MRKIIIAVVLLTVVLTSFFLITSKNDHVSDGRTAMEGLEIAEPRVMNWSEEYSIVYVSGTPSTGDGSGFETIYYRFWNGTNTSNNVLSLSIYKNEITHERYTTKEHDEFPIHNWTIDSDEAYSIAMKNEKIKAFMDRYDNAHVDGFYLTMPSENSSHPVWNIEWVDWGFMDDPHWAEIRIDATTGEVLYVEADLSGSSLSVHDICMGFFIVLMAVIAAAVLIVRKRGRKEQEKRRLEEEKINTEYELRKWDEEHGKRG